MKRILILAFLLVLLIFNGCSTGRSETSAFSNEREMPQAIDALFQWEHVHAESALYQLARLKLEYPVRTINENEIIHGGIFIRPLMYDTGLTGTFNPLFARSPADRLISELLNPSLLAVDRYGRFILGDYHHGPVIMEIDIDASVVILTMRDGLNLYWHDGTRMTLDSLYYHYFLSMHPHVDSIQGTSQSLIYQNIVGADAFIRRQADTISGISLSFDAREMTIQFYQGTISPSILYGGIHGVPIPRHMFYNVHVREMPRHIHSSWHTLGFGPFILSHYIPGEQLDFVANQNYWQGIPNLDGIVFQVIDRDDLPFLLRRGHIDVAPILTTQWDEVYDLSNVNILGDTSNFITMIHFQLGGFEMVQDGTHWVLSDILPRTDNHPITDARVRRAIAHALDRISIADMFGSGFMTLRLLF